MTGEFVHGVHDDAREIKGNLVESYKDIKPEKMMSKKELNDAVNNEFGKAAKDLGIQEKSIGIVENDKYTDKVVDGKKVENSETKEDVGVKQDIYEAQEKKGGSYQEVKKTSNGDTHEVHHMPSDSASNLEKDDGPAIKMDKEDHRQTASCGNSKEAREYREKQKELIGQGKFHEALQMDIDDIHDKFGNKYDDAISEMLDYVDHLESEGKING